MSKFEAALCVSVSLRCLCGECFRKRDTEGPQRHGEINLGHTGWSANFRTHISVRYDASDVSKSDRQTEGQLSERPLAELSREVIDADLSGAIRLSNGPAKIVVYFEKGAFLFATSNLRAHRFREVMKRQAPTLQIDEFPAALSDEDLAAA